MLTLALVGDIYLNRPDPATIFASTAERLRAADVLFGNCETPISEYGEPWLGKPVANNHLKMAPESVAGLSAVGFDVVGVASNHSLDFGACALLRTLELLESAGIGHCGAGKNADEAHRPAIVSKNGVTITFLAYTSVYTPGWEAAADRPGIATVRVETAYKPHARIHEQPGSPATTLNFPDAHDRERMVSDIRAAKDVADLVVVSWHWGVSENYRLLAPYQIELGHAALDAGADLLIGHHPHLLQGVEIYNGKPLFYSLGNFAFDRRMPWHSPESVVVQCQITEKRISRVSVLPCLINEGFVPELLPPESYGPVIRLLEESSAAFGVRFQPEGDAVVIS
jgi:poly-gamma-glutamate capsule biosynthesis protein CapA/YwtB (metallophosphatase superfamily)